MRPMESCGHTLQVWNPTELTLKNWRLWDGLGGVANLSLGRFGMVWYLRFDMVQGKSEEIQERYMKPDTAKMEEFYEPKLCEVASTVSICLGEDFSVPRSSSLIQGFRKGVWKYFSTQNDSAGSWKSLTLRGQTKFFIAWRDKIILTNPLLNPDYCWREGVLLMVGKCYKIWLGMINDPKIIPYIYYIYIYIYIYNVA